MAHICEKPPVDITRDHPHLFPAPMHFMIANRSSREFQNLLSSWSTCRCRTRDAPNVIRNAPAILHDTSLSPNRGYAIPVHFVVDEMSQSLTACFVPGEIMSPLRLIPKRRLWPRRTNHLIPHTPQDYMWSLDRWVYLRGGNMLHLGGIYVLFAKTFKSRLLSYFLSSTAAWDWVHSALANLSRFMATAPQMYGCSMGGCLRLLLKVSEVIFSISLYMFDDELVMWLARNSAQRTLHDTFRTCLRVVGLSIACVDDLSPPKETEIQRQADQIQHELYCVVARALVVQPDCIPASDMPPDLQSYLDRLRAEDPYDQLSAHCGSDAMHWETRCYSPGCL
jgi:hypothetical protein